MKRIIIDKQSLIIGNQTFNNSRVSLKILKAKYKDRCPEQFQEDLGDSWEDLQPITFEEACSIVNPEQRKVAFKALGVLDYLKRIDHQAIQPIKK